MRISCDPADPYYSADYVYFEVKLNGARLHWCQYADDKAGEVVILDHDFNNPYGSLKRNPDGSAIRKTIYGYVAIKDMRLHDVYREQTEADKVLGRACGYR